MPAVAGFKKEGANNGACLSFLISTPETGADSIALTYSLLGPILTVLRPVSAFLTALTAGVVENFTRPEIACHESDQSESQDKTSPCCCPTECDSNANHLTAAPKLRGGLSFAFDDLMSDLAPWLVVGILIAGLISAVVPESYISTSLGTGLLAYLAMLAVSLPLYVCATFSTPIAAALILKGMSPGAALVLLLAGPATNAATILMVGGLLGKRTLAIYLGSITVCTLALAFMTDFVYQVSGVSARAMITFGGTEFWPLWVEWAAAVILAIFIVRVFWRKGSAAFQAWVLSLGRTSTERPGPACSCKNGEPGST